MITFERTYTLKWERDQDSKTDTEKSSETSKGERKTWLLQTVPAAMESNTTPPNVLMFFHYIWLKLVRCLEPGRNTYKEQCC